MNRSRISRLGHVLLVLLMFTSSAHAHLTVEGAGQLGGGALHPLMTPAHALVLLSLALFLGQRRPIALKLPMLIFSIASAVALLVTFSPWVTEVPPPVLIGIALNIAGFVAWGKPMPDWLERTFCVIAAVAVALDSKADSGSTLDVLKTLLGTWFTMNLAVVYFAAVAANGEQKLWVRTAVRVVGAWIIAIAVMMLAFALRKTA